MKVLKGTILLFIVLFIATAAFSETGEAGPAMLKMMYGARLMSLGGAFVGLADDPFYMDSNPAGGQSETYRISIIHQEWIEDVNHESLRFTLGFDSLFMGIGYTFLYNKFEHYDYYGEEAGEYNLSQGFGTFNIGYIFNNLSFGTNLKFYHYNVPEELYAGQNEYVVAADFGVRNGGRTRIQIDSATQTPSNVTADDTIGDGARIFIFVDLTDKVRDSATPTSLVIGDDALSKS